MERVLATLLTIALVNTGGTTSFNGGDVFEVYEKMLKRIRDSEQNKLTGDIVGGSSEFERMNLNSTDQVTDQVKDYLLKYGWESKAWNVEKGELKTPKRMNECRQKILDALEETMNDTMQVFDFGAQKHPDSGNTPNFLTPNGNKCSLYDRGSSILRHAARIFMNPLVLDKESGLPEIQHLLASISMYYIRAKRGIVHGDDK